MKKSWGSGRFAENVLRYICTALWAVQQINILGEKFFGETTGDRNPCTFLGVVGVAWKGST